MFPIIHTRQQCQEILLELEPDEFLRSHVPVSLWLLGVSFIPGFMDRLCQKINPPSIGGGQSQSIPQGRRCDIDCSLIQLEEKSALVIFLSETALHHTLMRISLYRSLCCRSKELVEPTTYDLVPWSASRSNCCNGVYGPNMLP